MLQTDLGLGVEPSEALAARGFDTAERVKLRKPELWRAAQAMLGHGISATKIGELLAMDIRIVLAIQREGEATGAIPPYKERTVKQLEAVITLGLEALLDKAKAGKISAIELCALADKRELLSGGVTSRAAVVEDPATVEFRKFLQSVPATGRMVAGTGNGLEKAPAALEAPGLGGLPRVPRETVDGELLEGTEDN